MNANANGIHKGLVTHHQDQSITFVNFNIKNVMNSKLFNPADVWLLLLSDIG
jgi:hypothetical protein